MPDPRQPVDYGEFDRFMRSLGRLLGGGARRWWRWSWKWRLASATGLFVLLSVLAAPSSGRSSRNDAAVAVEHSSTPLPATPTEPATPTPPQPTSTSTSRPPTATPTPRPNLAPLAAGATARSGGLAITVAESLDPFLERNQFEQPPAGTHYVGLRLVLQDIGKGDYIFSRPELRASDGNGFSSEVRYITSDQPQLESQHLNAGAKADGWVYFTVKDGSSISRLEYTPFYPEDPHIVFGP